MMFFFFFEERAFGRGGCFTLPFRSRKKTADAIVGWRSEGE